MRKTNYAVLASLILVSILLVCSLALPPQIVSATSELDYLVSYDMETEYATNKLYDFSKHERHGTIVAGNKNVTGYYGKCISGPLQVNVPGAGASSFTIMGWIYPTSAGFITFAGHLSGPTRILKSDTQRMCYQYGTYYIYANDTVPINAWTHIVFSYNSIYGVGKWYYNATEKGSGTLMDAGKEITL